MEDEAAPQDVAPASLVERVIDAYRQLFRQQEQKLSLARYVLDRQQEIDDPVLVVLHTMEARYTHLDHTQLLICLQTLYNSFSMTGEDAAPGKSNTGLRVSGDLEEIFRECGEYVPLEYVPACFFEMARQVLESARTGNQTDDFRSSLFVGLIADFEAFVVNVLVALYQESPAKLFRKDRTVDLRQLFDAESLEELREQVVERATVDVMRGSVHDWLGVLAHDHHVKVDQYVKEPQLTEMFQRRHILSHNGGRVSRLYLEKTPKSTAALGERLDVSADYFERCADILVSLSLGLTVNILIKHASDHAGPVENSTANFVYELLLRRRYDAVVQFASELPFDRMQDQSAVEICRVNLWVSLKRLGRFDECRAEVESWQVDHLHDRFKLARFALLGEVQEAYELSRAMLDADALPLQHYVEWPMLEEVREYEATTASSLAEVVDDEPAVGESGRSEIPAADRTDADGYDEGSPRA